jgi:hypothetical protein
MELDSGGACDLIPAADQCLKELTPRTVLQLLQV